MALADDLLTVLDDPTHMWSHALKELSNDAQRLFLTLTLLPKPVSSDILQIAYTSQKFNKVESFLDSLRSLEDSFISIERRYADLRAVSFRNPSLEDFANVYLDSNSDWLDILLSSPKYYEQVLSVFNLAMTQTAIIIDSRTRRRKAAPSKYPGINLWIKYRANQLIELGIDLLEVQSAEIFVDSTRSRLSQILKILFIYGAPTNKASARKLKAAAEAELNPSTHASADVMLNLLRNPNYRSLLDKIIQGDAAMLMRANVLDKGTWKFTILCKLDELLRLDSVETWNSWGQAYVDYAKGLARDLADSDDDDDLRVAIEEMTDINNMLDADLYDEINMLEERRSSLPKEEDYNDIESGAKAPRSTADASAQLDVIFGSLL